ncbi:MAG: hypothetical protein QM286_13720 [Acidobacteriota bacterium]|nr:hypothetical protein [Acidobacteriota bacterium]
MEVWTEASWREYNEHRDQIRNRLIDVYKAMSDRQRKRLLLVEYRCAAKQCLLLRAWNSPLGPATYQPPYILTPERNLALSSASGRGANTTDGNNHWRERGGLWSYTDDWGNSLGILLACRHVYVSVLASDIHRDILAGAPGSPVRRRIVGVSVQDNGVVPLGSVESE